MIKFSFFDNIIDFINELIGLLKEDWIKFKLFFKENKSYIIWLFITLITLQITDIMSLGASFNIYQKKNNMQKGGSVEPLSESSKKIASEKKRLLDKSTSKKKAKEDKAKSKSDKQSTESESKSKEGSETSKDGDSKDVRKKLSMFKRLQGPVLGNFGGIFAALEGIFSVFVFILIIVGILSLPIFIFLIITYCVIKHIVGKLTIY